MAFAKSKKRAHSLFCIKKAWKVLFLKNIFAVSFSCLCFILEIWVLSKLEDSIKSKELVKWWHHKRQKCGGWTVERGTDFSGTVYKNKKAPKVLNIYLTSLTNEHFGEEKLVLKVQYPWLIKWRVSAYIMHCLHSLTDAPAKPRKTRADTPDISKAKNRQEKNVRPLLYALKGSLTVVGLCRRGSAWLSSKCCQDQPFSCRRKYLTLYYYRNNRWSYD